MIRRPPRSTLFPTRRSSDLQRVAQHAQAVQRVVHHKDDVGVVRGVAGVSAAVGGRHLWPLRVLIHRSPLFLRLLHPLARAADRKSTRLNSSHLVISYAVFCLKKKKTTS